MSERVIKKQKETPEQVCYSLRMYLNDFNPDAHPFGPWVAAILRGDYGPPDPLVWDTILDYLMSDKMRYPIGARFRRALPPIMEGLASPDCPAHILAVAASTQNPNYSTAARANPNCPEQYEVYAALWRGRQS